MSEGDGRVEKYLTLRQTFFPVGSSVCEENNEQQSRTLRAPRRRFISTDSQKNKLRHQIFFFLLYIASKFFSPSNLFFQKNQRWHSERRFVPFCLPSIPLVLYREASCGSSAAGEVKTPGFPLPISWGSQSHFLLFSQTQSFLKMVED